MPFRVFWSNREVTQTESEDSWESERQRRGWAGCNPEDGYSFLGVGEGSQEEEKVKGGDMVRWIGYNT